MADPYRRVGITRATPLWHGGAPGIEVGEHIEPNHVLESRGIFYGSRGVGDLAAGRVYVSPRPDFARVFATRTKAFAGRGTLYRVRPVASSSLDFDVDYPADASLSCSRAVVEEIVETNISIPEVDGLKIMAPYLTWVDSSPVYDENGYMTPAPNWPGADPDQVRSLGPWNQIADVLYNPDTKKAYVR